MHDWKKNAGKRGFMYNEVNMFFLLTPLFHDLVGIIRARTNSFNTERGCIRIFQLTHPVCKCCSGQSCLLVA